MLYAILCYNNEAVVGNWTRDQDAKVMADHLAVQERLKQTGKLGPVVRLMPTTTAMSVRSGEQPLVFDGPFAETKEQLLGFYVVDCENLDEVLEIAKQLSIKSGVMEVRPIMHFFQDNVPTTQLSAQ
jgi:hypothetical protein